MTTPSHTESLPITHPTEAARDDTLSPHVPWLLGLGGALALLVLFVIVRGSVDSVIDLIPLADRRDLVVQAANNVNSFTVGVIAGRLQFLLLAGAGLALAYAGQAMLGLQAVARVPRLADILRWLLANPALLVALVLLVLSVVYIDRRSVLIEGVRYYYLEDDAMVSMRYARNWANGLGPVWNPGERVEGYTNFLWVAIMAVVHRLGVPENMTSLYIMALSWLMLIATVFLIQNTLKRLGVGLLWVYAACLIYALDENVLQWTRNALETNLLALCGAVCVWAVTRGSNRIFLVALALLPLARSDAFILAGMLGLYYLAINRHQWRQALVELIIAVVPTILHFAFRRLYYGDWWPNTYYLKATGVPDLWRIGLSYSFRIWVTYPILLLLAAGTLVVRDVDVRLRLLVPVIAVQIAYIIYVGGDTFWYLRPFAPVQPLVVLCAAATLHEVTRQAARRSQLVLAGAALLVTPVAAWGGQLFEIPVAAGDLFEGELQLVARYIELNTAPGTRVALDPAGIVPYFADEQFFIDPLGKSDSHIAHLPALPGNTLVGHNKFDWDYVLNERQPDLIFASCSLNEARQRTPEDWARLKASLPNNAYTSIIYLLSTPTFWSHYANNRITFVPPENTDVRVNVCFYAREGSNIPTIWTLTPSFQGLERLGG